MGMLSKGDYLRGTIGFSFRVQILQLSVISYQEKPGSSNAHLFLGFSLSRGCFLVL